MKLTKPIEEFTLEELEESHRCFQSLIENTELLLTELANDECGDFRELMENATSQNTPPDSEPISFTELANKNLDEFQDMKLKITCELIRREVTEAAAKAIEKYADALKGLK